MRAAIMGGMALDHTVLARRDARQGGDLVSARLLLGAMQLLLVLAGSGVLVPARAQGQGDPVNADDATAAAAASETATTGSMANEGNQLFVVPPDWIPGGYLNPSDGDDVNPFRFRSAEEFRSRLDRYLDEIVARRAGIESVGWRRLDEAKREAFLALVDQRRGNHRLLPRGPEARLDSLAVVMGVALGGGREAQRSGIAEYYSRVVLVVEADEDSGYEIDEGQIGELDRLSRPGGLIPAVDVVVLPVSRLESLAAGDGVDRYRSDYHLSFDRPLGLVGRASDFERRVAERALEQILLDEILRSKEEDRNKRKTTRDLLGTVTIGEESHRFAYRHHETARKLRPLRSGIRDLYRWRYPNLLGAMEPREPVGIRTVVTREKDEVTSREYRVRAEVGEDHPGGPLVLQVPECLSLSTAVVSIEYRAPGAESFQRIDPFREGAWFVPKDLGYRVETRRREPVVTAVPVPPGTHEWRVRVVGRRI